jgi:hypothetical protein
MRLKGKIDVIKEISISDDDGDRGDEGFCIDVINKKLFLPCKEIQGKLNLEKFKTICDDLLEMIKNLIDEVKNEKSFGNLIKFVDDYAMKYIEINKLIKHHKRQKHAVDNLKYVHELVNREKGDKTDNSEELFFQWKCNYHQNLYDIKYQKNFQLSWIQSQVEQNEFRLNLVENKTKSEVQNFKEKKSSEHKTFRRIKNFYSLKIKELQAEVKRMSAEYDKQIDEVELRYQIAAEEKKRFQQSIDNEMKFFAQREQEIKDFIALREKKAADKRLREMQEQKAVKLQSWWRGEMVRKYKGPFKFFRRRAQEVDVELELEKKNAKSAALKAAKKKKN